MFGVVATTGSSAILKYVDSLTAPANLLPGLLDSPLWKLVELSPKRTMRVDSAPLVTVLVFSFFHKIDIYNFADGIYSLVRWDRAPSN